MFDCCANNRCDCGPFYNGCPPTNLCCRRSCSTEFPKQRGPFVEEKFSKFNPPSFLCNTGPPKARVKTRSCSCSSKYPRVSKNCQCKAKGITDCRKPAKEDGKRVCDKSCEANDKSASDKDDTVKASRAGATPSVSYESNMLGATQQAPANAIWQGPDGSSIAVGNRPNGAANPAIPVYDYIAQRNPVGQKPQQLNNMPAAGLPTRQDPPFDPCTGRERQAPIQFPPGPNGGYGMPMTCLYPCFYPMQCYPCPTAMNVCPPMQQGVGQPTNTQVDQADRSEQPKNQKEGRERSEKAKNERNKARTPENEQSNGKEREIVKAGKVRRKDGDNNHTQLINCSCASPELIQRICESLQVSRPPENCYILLPISMATKEGSKQKARDDPPPKKDKSNSSVDKKKAVGAESSSVEGLPLSIEQSTKSQNLTSKSHSSTPKTESKAAAKQVARPTRNCGCNTVISGTFEETSQKSEEALAPNSCSAGGCCNSGSCYARPRYTYCYNPCTGYFYWRKKCCCCACNGCCNNGCGGGSCPMPKQPTSSPSSKSPATSPGSKSPPSGSSVGKKRSPNDTSKSNVSSKEHRSAAGAMSTFQPGVQELYDQWLGFQQHAAFPPMMPPRQPQQQQPQPQQLQLTQPGTFVSSVPIYFRSTRFYPAPFQMNGTGISSQSPALIRNEPNYRYPDIDWTPQ